MVNMFIYLLFTLALSLQTNVILTFDDGWDEHYNVSLILDEFNIKGTFYINSARVGKTRRMNLDELYNLVDRGHEIAAHTETHLKLVDQSYETQFKEICDDRKRLMQWGFNVTTFAYPFGGDTYESYDILSECGFNSARDSGGIRTNSSCGNCPTTESSPPDNPMQLRSFSYRSDMGVEGLKAFVIQALNRDESREPSEGALIIVFHEYGFYFNKEANITPQEFVEFLAWLTSQPNINVKTVNEFIGGEIQPILKNLQNDNVNAGSPHISLTFDDGTIDHLSVSNILEKYDFRGTFFINSDNINKEGFLRRFHLIRMNEKGHEIGGHTKSGPRLTTLNNQTLTNEIGDDKERLSRWLDGNVDGGDSITSISWPFGESNETIEELAKNFGYLRGRDVGGIKVQTSCSKCPSSVDIPVTNSMRVRSFIVKSFHSLGDLMWQVLRAEESYTNNPGKEESVLTFTFHRICDGCATGPDEFEKFIRWLKPRANRGTTVRLFRDVV